MKSLPGEPTIAAFARVHQITCTAECVAPGLYAWQALHGDRQASGEIACALEVARSETVTDEARGLMCLEAVVYAARRATMPGVDLAAEPDAEEALDAYDALLGLLGTEALVEAVIEAARAGYPLERKSGLRVDIRSDRTVK